MDNEQEFFKRYGEYNVKLYFYASLEGISVEDLYQAFKARLLRELQDEQSTPPVPPRTFCSEEE